MPKISRCDRKRFNLLSLTPILHFSRFLDQLNLVVKMVGNPIKIDIDDKTLSKFVHAFSLVGQQASSGSDGQAT